MKFAQILLPLCFLTLISCHRDKHETIEDRRTDAQHLIDQGRTDEAISVLENDPEISKNAALQISLASAYAARAGLVVKNYWRVFVQQSDFTIPVRANEKNSYSKRDRKDQIAILLYLLEQQNEVTQWLQQMTYLPVMNAAQILDLQKAQNILANQKDRSARLYRVFITIVIAKALVMDNPRPEDLAKGKGLSARGLQTNNFFMLVDQLKLMGLDLIYLFPARKAEFQDTIYTLDFISGLRWITEEGLE